MIKRNLVIVLLLASLAIAAQDTADSTEATTDFILVPLGMYSGETSAVLGGVAVYTHRPHSLPMHISPNALMLNLMVSFKGQFQGILVPEYQLSGGAYSLTGYVKYRYWPTAFYGVGNNSDKDDRERYVIKEAHSYLQLRKRFREILLTGVGWEYISNRLSEKEDGGMLEQEIIPGSEDHELSAARFSVEFDTRDNTYYPTRGLFYDMNIRLFDRKIGSDYSFVKYKADLANFFPIAVGHTLCWHGMAIFTQHEGPYEELSRLGGEMRGFDSQRYIDNHMLMSRLEYRVFPFEKGIWERFGSVVFAEYGQVAHEVSDFRWDETHYTYGMGLRYRFNDKERFNFRLDFGYAGDEYDIIFTAREAF